ncbi:MAG: hypothetical protein M0T85_02335 [Dehalococcoidales bacterium]|nr:hypothetical protein [Dehalococcoidales bacterium]
MTPAARGNGFDPASRLSTLEDGTQYLGARDRLLWFLQEQEEFSMTSQVEGMSSALVVVKVTVAIQGGKKVEALGSAATNGDYRAVETAETHALARALALLGYGTESALELDSGSAADAPARDRQKGNGKAPGSSGNGQHRETVDLPSWARLPAPGKGPDGNGKAPNEAGRGVAADGEGRGERDGHGMPPALICSDCQGHIKEGKTRDGTTLTADEVAERSRKQFSRPLCARCLVKQMAQSKPKEAKTA